MDLLLRSAQGSGNLEVVENAVIPHSPHVQASTRQRIDDGAVPGSVKGLPRSQDFGCSGLFHSGSGFRAQVVSLRFWSLPAGLARLSGALQHVWVSRCSNPPKRKHVKWSSQACCLALHYILASRIHGSCCGLHDRR